MKNVMGIFGQAALVAALACAPAFAVRPEVDARAEASMDVAASAAAALVSPSESPYRAGFKKTKRLVKEHLLEAGENLRGGKVDLRGGDVSVQIPGRLNRLLRQGGGDVRINRIQTDSRGNRHIRLQQYHHGFPVIGSDMVVHVNRAGEIYGTGGYLTEGLVAKAEPTLKADQARARTRSLLHASVAAVERQAPRLVVFDDVLAYESILEEPGHPPAVWKVYVHAEDGTLLHRENRIVHGAPVGGAAHPVTGSLLVGEGGGTVTLNGWRDDGSIYFLHNRIARWGVYDQDRFDWSQNLTGDWGVTDRAAVSLARNMESTLRYAADVLSLDSYDDAGTLASAYVHEGTDYVNAYWDGSGFHFGDGDGITANPLTVLDVAAHEFGHAITQYSSGLVYSYESGALNESYSDILGALVEFWAQPDGRTAYPAGQDGRADYLMGEDCWISGEALRDLRNPGRFGQPSYYRGTNWYSGSGDNGGVHYNSGVQNFTFYLLAEGGVGSNDGRPYNISGLGIEAAGAIAMYANMFLLTSGSQYQDAREAWVLAATTLGHNAQTVRDVWTACGVLDQVNNLAVSLDSLAFGNVGAGSTEIRNLTFLNNGALATTVTGLTFSNLVFSTSATVPFAVPGGSSVTVGIRFLPPATGTHNGVLTIASNADDNPSLTVVLSGAGTDPAGIEVAPASLNAALPVGDTAALSLTVTNTGVADLVFTPRTQEIESPARLTAGGKRVLYLHAGANAAAFRTVLDTLSNIDTLSVFDGSLSSPTAALLAAHDVVIVASSNYWFSPPGIGDLLADYVDAGGGVILLGATFHVGGNWMLQGRIMTSAYAPLAAVSYSISNVTSVTLVDHPINQGVTLVTSSLWANSTALQGAGVSLGTFTGGYHVGAYNPQKPIVSLNAYPVATYYGGDMLRQLQNAIDFTGGSAWLRMAREGTPIRIPQGASAALEVVLDARDIQGGSYSGAVNLTHNVPGIPNPLVVPVTLAVDGFRRLSASPLALAFGNLRAGGRDSLTLTLTNTGDEATALTAFEFDNPEFSLSGTPPALLPGHASLTLRVVFSPVDLGSETGTLTILSDSEDNPEILVSLTGAGTPAPGLELAPAAFALTLPTGEADTRTLVISNPGGDDLHWSLRGAGIADSTSAASPSPAAQGPIHILAWVPLVDIVGEYANVVTALRTYADSFTIDTSWTYSPAALEAALEDKHVFLIPERERGAIPAGTGAAFASVLQAFVNRGGVVILHYPNDVAGATFMREAGLMDFTYGFGGSSGNLTLLNPSHPLLAGIAPPLTLQDATAGVTFRDSSNVLATYNGYAVLAERMLGRGRVILMGLDFFAYTPNWGRVLANAVGMGESTTSWLSTSVLADTLAPGESRAITLTADATGLLGGVYQGDLTLVHNAPAVPSPLAIPFTLTVDGVRRLAANPVAITYGNVWQGTTSRRTVTISNPGSESTTITAVDIDNSSFRCTVTLPLVLRPFDSVVLAVDFVASELTSETGLLTLVSDAEDMPLLGISLSGTATPPPVATLTPEHFDIHLDPSDAPADRTATLSNVGGDRLHYQITRVSQTGSPGQPGALAPLLSAAPAAPDWNRIYAASNYRVAHEPGEIIVALKSGQQNFAATSLPTSLGVLGMRELAVARNPRTGMRSHGGRKLILLKLSPQGLAPLPDIINVIRQDAHVEYAEPNYIRRLVGIPNDPSFGSLYGMHNTGQLGGRVDADIDAPEAWDRHTGNRSLVVGVIDTGIDWLHPDLAANMWTNAAELVGTAGIDDDGNGYVDDIHGYDFINRDALPMDDHGHGSHCAGTIGAVGNNAIGVAGVAWIANMAALKIFNSAGSTNDAAILDAVDYSNAMGMKITSNSWGGGPYSQSLFDLIAEGQSLGHLFIAAAGNSSSNNDASPHYPSSYALDNIISVAATDRLDNRASFSSYGATSVDLGAPGTDILSCAPGGGYQSMSGTSMATPHVSGAAFLVWSSNPFLTASQVRDVLFASVDPIASMAGVTVTGGRLNVSRALDEAGPAWLSAGPMVPGELAPGDSVPLRLTVNPAGLIAGTWTGSVTVATDDPVRPVLSVTVAAHISGCRSLAVEPDSLDFGSRFTGSVTPQTLRLRNDCNDTTTVSSLAFSHPYFRSPGSSIIRIPPFSVVEHTLEFAPSSAITLAGTLTLTSNADRDSVQSIALTAISVDPPVATIDPPSIARNLASGATTTVDLTIGNAGGSPLQWRLDNVQRGLAASPTYDSAHYQPQAKGETDTRIGYPVLGAAGGPDAFGYRWMDSNEPNGPAYVWNDIRTTGQSVAGGCDDCYAIVPLSFAFPIYGSSFTSLNITSNGWVNFGSPSSQYSNYPLPSTSMPRYLVAGFFDDLETYSGSVYFQDFGDRAVIQYQDVRRLSGDGTLTFQIVLRADGSIHLYYANVTGNLLSATTGIQNGSGTVGMAMQYNTTYIRNGLAVRIGMVPDWLRASVLSDTVEPGETQVLTLTLDANGLAPGTYTQTMTLAHNNPLMAGIPVPVTLSVNATGMSRVLRIGPSALAAAAGSRYSLWNITVGGDARGLARGSRYVLYLK